VTSHQLPVNSDPQTVILNRRMSLSRAASRERIYLNSHPDASGFLNSTLKTHNLKLSLIYICASLCTLWLNLFSQNKPNPKTTPRHISPCQLRTTNNGLRTGAVQNKPKTNPNKPNYMVSQEPAQRVKCCGLGRKPVGQIESYLHHEPRQGRHKNTKKRNEPNIINSKMTASHFSTIVYCSLMTGNCPKTKPIEPKFYIDTG